jgi:hypothetical protein
VKVPKPVPMLDEQVKMAMAGLLRVARKDGRLDELADAFRRYYAAHLVPPRVAPSMDVAAVLAAELKRRKDAAAVAIVTPPSGVSTSSAEVADASAVAIVPKVVTEVAVPPSVAAKPHDVATHAVARDPEEPYGGSPPQKRRDLARDITPDADNDEYGELPTEERIALHEDRAAMHRHAPRQDADEVREPEPRVEEWWELGKVVHLHQATQCGRVCLSEGGEELHFTDRTPLEPGLVLKVGQQVDCRVVERPGRYPTIAELATPVPA